MDHVLEAASLVTERLLATDATDHSFLDAFLQGVDDLEDDKEESLVSVSIPTGGASLVEEPTVVEEAPAEPPAPSPVEAEEESDDEYGDDSYEDEEYGDDDFDDFEEDDGGDFSQDISIEDYLRKVFDSVDVNGDGEISTQEAVKAVKADAEFAAMLGLTPLQVGSDYTKDQLEMALEQLDTDESGSVSWEEFRSAPAASVDEDDWRP